MPICLQSLDYPKLVRRARSNSKSISNPAFNEIVRRLNRMLRAICKEFRIPGNTYEDNYQECLLALQEAIEKYDPSKGDHLNYSTDFPFEIWARLTVRSHVYVLKRRKFNLLQQKLNTST